LELELLSQGLWVFGVDHDYVAADSGFQFGRRRNRHQSALVQNADPIASFGFFHMMRR
jgi:hypothetical protein